MSFSRCACLGWRRWECLPDACEGSPQYSAGCYPEEDLLKCSELQPGEHAEQTRTRVTPHAELTHPCRSPIRVCTGVSCRGRVTGVEAQTVQDSGCFPSLRSGQGLEPMGGAALPLFAQAAPAAHYLLGCRYWCVNMLSSLSNQPALFLRRQDCFVQAAD